MAVIIDKVTRQQVDVIGTGWLVFWSPFFIIWLILIIVRVIKIKAHRAHFFSMQNIQANSKDKSINLCCCNLMNMQAAESKISQSNQNAQS